MAKLKIRTTVTYTLTTTVDGERVTAKDIARIKRDVRKDLDYSFIGNIIADAVDDAAWGTTTLRKPVVTVEAVAARPDHEGGR